MLHLHVYPPSFTLPSISAPCIATIAYFSAAIPSDQYRLVADVPNNNPTGELPALSNGEIWVGGWPNIVDYVRKLDGRWDLDGGRRGEGGEELEGRERADLIAFTSLLTSSGQSLLDLSLYVSSPNYSTTTRPTYSFLPFPLSWTLPHRLRAQAKARTAHLGLSSLDIDSSSSSPADPSSNPVPESLRTKSSPTPTTLLSSPENAAQIRLHALATSFLQPLQDLRGQKRFFISDRPTSLDCLAMGYLSLMLFPDLPSPWLATTIRGEFPQLGAFVHDMQSFFFHGPVSLDDAGVSSLSPASSDPGDAEREREKRVLGHGREGLPWTAAPTRGFIDLAKTVGSHIADNIPVISDVLSARRIQHDLEEEAERDPERVEELAVEHHRASVVRKEILTSVGTVVVGVGLFVGFLIRQGVLGAIAGNVQNRVAKREAEEGGFSWDTNKTEEEHVPSGLSNLASQMDFLGDMQFGAPQPNRVELEAEADVVR